MQKNKEGLGYVLHDWVSQLSWKQQSTLFSSLRGPDTSYSPLLKKMSKWMRGLIQNNADISSNYMNYDGLPSPRDIEKEFEFCTVHFAAHFLQGLEIIAYKHPQLEIADIARRYYIYLVQDVVHLNPETEDQLNSRLEDRVNF